LLPPPSPTATATVLCAGFHTFDYARHFLSCCSRMLGLEHETSRGSITIDYYGRAVGIKIMPTGEQPHGCGWVGEHTFHHRLSPRRPQLAHLPGE
jgi:trehalose 6-phosphate synthase/phosphatase